MMMQQTLKHQALSARQHGSPRLPAFSARRARRAGVSIRAQASPQQQPGGPSFLDNERLIASATSIGLNGTLAIGLAKVAGLDLWSKFDWGATDDFKLALFLGGPLLAYELLLLGIPWYSPFLSKKASSSITINSDGSMARSAGESQTSSSSSSSGSNSAGSSSIPVFKGSSIGAEADDEEKPTGAWLPHKDAQGKWEKGEAGSAPPPSAPSGSGEADAGHGQEEAAGSSRSAITSAEGSGGNGSSGSSSSGSSTEAASARKPGPMDEELSSLTRTISDSRKTPSGKAKSKKGGLPFNMRIDASSLGDGGQSLNAETIKIALALQQAAFTATQAVMRAGTPFALDAGLTLARDAAKELLQRGLIVSFVAAWLADRAFEAGADDSWAGPGGTLWYTTEVCRWFTASLASALLLAPALNDAKALGLTVATNQAVLMSEAGDEDAQDDLVKEYRLYDCLQRSLGGVPAKATQVLHSVRGAARAVAANATFAITGNLAASLFVSSLSSFLLLAYASKAAGDLRISFRKPPGGGDKGQGKSRA